MLALLFATLLGGQDAAAQPRQTILNEDRCSRTVSSGGFTIVESKGNRACVDFQPQREFSGLWVNHFEGSVFLEGAASVDDLPRARTPEVWFDTDSETRFPKAFPPLLRAHVFRVRFRGRAASDMHRKPLEGYGHLGSFSGLVLADEILEIADLGEDPRR